MFDTYCEGSSTSLDDASPDKNQIRRVDPCSAMHQLGTMQRIVSLILSNTVKIMQENSCHHHLISIDLVKPDSRREFHLVNPSVYA